MSYRPRLKKQISYKITEYKKCQDYYGFVGKFSIICGSMDGYSIANSLRRNILSKSVGYTIVSYKIEGSESPFDTIHGFDLTTNTIVDNLSKIQFSLLDEGDYDITSCVKEEKFTGVITAGMFESDNIKVHNPDLVIANVSNSTVGIYCGIGIGYGYMNEEEQKSCLELSEGWFAKEAYFNPVIKVSYTCHQYGNEDIINFDIYTQLNSDPLFVFNSSARDLSYIYGIQIDEGTTEDSMQNTEEICNSFLNISIDDCKELSVRARNALKQGGINDLRWLFSFSPSSLSSKISGIGEKSIKNVGNFLSSYINDELVASLKKFCDDKMINNINSYIMKSQEDSDTEDDDAFDDDNVDSDDTVDDSDDNLDNESKEERKNE